MIPKSRLAGLDVRASKAQLLIDGNIRPTTRRIPACLQRYLDVFSTENAKKLTLHHNINSMPSNYKPGEKPLYGPFIPLLPWN